MGLFWKNTEKNWEKWEKIKNARFEMKQNSKYNGYGHMARLANMRILKNGKQFLVQNN